MPSYNTTLPIIVSACISGTFNCETLLVFTNILVWFSLSYSCCRLILICYWLLHHSYQQNEDEDVDPTEAQKNCLWEMAGTLIIAYEVILSLLLGIGTGSFGFEINSFFLLLWCLNYPVFLMLHWVLGIFLTKCCEAQRRMKRSSLSNFVIVALNIFWRVFLYWCALNLLFHPDIHKLQSEDADYPDFNNSIINASYYV